MDILATHDPLHRKGNTMSQMSKTAEIERKFTAGKFLWWLVALVTVTALITGAAYWSTTIL